MKIFSSEQIKEIDQSTIEELSILSWDLMERAATAFSSKVMSNISKFRNIKIFCGSGNNGGDGLAIGRILISNAYTPEIYIISGKSSRTPDNEKNLSLLQTVTEIHTISYENEFPIISENDVIIDALFGAGLSRPLEGLAAQLVRYLNSSSCYKIAVDIPSGVPGEGIVGNDVALKADQTFTFQFPFVSFFLEENAEYIGKWEILDIGIPMSVIQNINTSWFCVNQSDILIKRRSSFGHKGTFGHALLITGKKGMSGAALLSAKACLKTGCGLVTAHVPGYVAPILQQGFPEAICSIDPNDDYVSILPSLEKFSSIGMGPGLGGEDETCRVLDTLFKKANVPLVLDADALNIVANHSGLLMKIPAYSILTPHPGEFDRLFGKSRNSFERIKLQQSKAVGLQLIIVLKGKHTSISFPNGEVLFNTSGNSGMATAGSGDVLTGMITSLLAQGYNPQEAAITGVFLHGVAGDCTLNDIEPQSIVASDIIDNISCAFRKIKMNC